MIWNSANCSSQWEFFGVATVGTNTLRLNWQIKTASACINNFIIRSALPDEPWCTMMMMCSTSYSPFFSFDLQFLEYVGIASDAFVGSLPRFTYMATYHNMFWASTGNYCSYKKLLDSSRSDLLCTCRSAMKLNVKSISAQHSITRIYEISSSLKQMIDSPSQLCQVGFTTDPVDDRSTMYSSDLGKGRNQMWQPMLSGHNVERNWFSLVLYFAFVSFLVLKQCLSFRNSSVLICSCHSYDER